MDDLLKGVIEGHRTSRRKHGNTGPFRKDLRPLQISCTREFAAFVARAAKARGVNRTSFVRRAIAVAAASVLNEDVRQILYFSPRVRPFEYNSAENITHGGERDEGEGIESWCPHPGCSGQHLVR